MLIALRKAPQETTPPGRTSSVAAADHSGTHNLGPVALSSSLAPDKRAKRPRGQSPSTTTTTTTPAAAAAPTPLTTGRGTSIVVQPRGSVGPQQQQVVVQQPQVQQLQAQQQLGQGSQSSSSQSVPFSREPKARREALAKQLPLEKGRKVAFHPPQNTKGAEGLGGGKDEEWILAVVTKCINQDKNRSVDARSDALGDERQNFHHLFQIRGTGSGAARRWTGWTVSDFISDCSSPAHSCRVKMLQHNPPGHNSPPRPNCAAR